MALREPHVSCINSLKKSNLPKALIFGLIQTVERERERGIEGEKAKLLSSIHGISSVVTRQSDN